MPDISTPVQHYKQSNPGMCLPACARMVTAALGDTHSEMQLANVMNSYEFGTPASRVTRLTKLGYNVQYSSFTLYELRDTLKQSLFPIVLVKASELPWADFSGFHALVLINITQTEVQLHDPAMDAGPSKLTIEAFMLAWDEFDCLAAIISK